MAMSVIIKSVGLPELDGLDMILELTRQFLHAKVIAISGMGGKANVLDVAKLFGARRTFQKSFSMPRLLDAVRYELDH
jgi:DNA-binding NarL/FixJ family response regulator